MAVYTALEKTEIENLIKPYGIGPLINYEGVAAGIENTTYFITTDQSSLPSELKTKNTGEFVLTVYETASPQDLDFYVQLTTLLNHSGLPVPCPIENTDGSALQWIHGKPMLLIPKIAGRHPLSPTLAQCHTIAATLAQLHQACLTFGLDHENSHNLAWLEDVAKTLTPNIDTPDVGLMDEIIRFKQRILEHPNLPRSITHSDLFRDNALFDEDELTAIIDFNSAGNGFLAFDLAVLVNDWCSNENGTLNVEKASACLEAYQQIRPLTDDEQALWNDFLRIAATRFWASRLEVEYQLKHRSSPADLIEHKDPNQYKQVLLERINNPMILTH